MQSGCWRSGAAHCHRISWTQSTGSWSTERQDNSCVTQSTKAKRKATEAPQLVSLVTDNRAGCTQVSQLACLNAPPPWHQARGVCVNITLPPPPPATPSLLSRHDITIIVDWGIKNQSSTTPCYTLLHNFYLVTKPPIPPRSHHRISCNTNFHLSQNLSFITC